MLVLAGLYAGAYLDLLLQGLDVVDDLVEHAGLSGDLVAPGHQLLQVPHPLADPLPSHLRIQPHRQFSPLIAVGSVQT